MTDHENNTKNRILTEALSLFAIKGFGAVTVAEIADAVGIKAPSLYKHYASKQSIFEGIIIEMEKRFAEQTMALNFDGHNAVKDKDFFMNINDAELIGIGKNLFLFFLKDEFTSKFRKMLTIEQFSNQPLAFLYAKRYIDDSLSYHITLFNIFIKTGMLIPENADIMALHFYAPIYLMLNLCDCCPDRETEALNIIEQHIMQFNRLYKNNID